MRMDRLLGVVCASSTLLAAAGASGSSYRGDDVRYVDASLETQGRVLGVSFADVDGDDSVEVCLAVLTEGGERELRFHRMSDARLSGEPFRVVPVFDEVVAYGFADVRAETGRELLFLVKDGVWSYSLEQDGFRGNLKRLVDYDLLFDVPDAGALPEWKYIIPHLDGDRVLLPGHDGYALFAPASGDAAEEAGGPTYALLSEHIIGSIDVVRPERLEAGNSISMGAGGVRISSRAPGAETLPKPFLTAGGAYGDLLRSGREYAAPALVDVDGDGVLDLVTFDGSKLTSQLSSGVERVELAPEYLSKASGKGVDLDLRFADLNGDGRLDLLGQLEESGGSVANSSITLLVMLNDGERLFPEQPHQVMRFEAADLRVYITDVDGDGRPDLGVREFVLPSLMGTLVGVEFELSHLLFLGQKGARVFGRKPILKHTATFDEHRVQEALAGREWEWDCDGDGLADIVEIDVEGRVSIRRVLRTESFFGKASWSLEDTAWTRFETVGRSLSIDVYDLNGDGLGDIVSQGESAVLLLLSNRVGGSR